MSKVTNKQGIFLRKLCVHSGTVEQLRASLKIPLHILMRWMSTKAFKRELLKRMTAMGRIRELDVKRGAMEGARRLSKAAFGAGDFTKKNLYERAACTELVRLARVREREEEMKRLVEKGKVSLVMNERERVGALHGPGAVEAYDGLVKLREEREGARGQGEASGEV